jgi:hypothetical protein
VQRRRRADAVTREQIRWLAFVGLTALALFVTNPLITALFGNGSAASNTWFVALAVVLILGAPAAVAVAVMKYHLYDIDIVINKTWSTRCWPCSSPLCTSGS